MAAKRFASHDVQMRVHDASRWPDTAVTVTCRRCDAEATEQPRGDRDPLYRALTAIEQQPCALVSLDERGYPAPIA